MAAVHDPNRTFGKDIISTYSENPEEAALAQRLYAQYMGGGNSTKSWQTFKLQCSSPWLTRHYFSVKAESREAAINVHPLCPKCGRNWL